MKILLIGANGQLGHDLLAALPSHDVLPTARGASLAGEDKTAIALDVCDTREVRATINSFAPAIVINCSAFHRVDDIEKDAAQALAVNAQAVQQLALACRDADAALLHVSTDYVFDGAKTTPYTEADLPNPISAYGASKLAGELLLSAAWPKHYIVRTCGLYGMAGASGKAEGPRSAAKGSGNFVNTMLRLASENKMIKVVNDQTCTPTFTKDLAQQITALIETGAFGTYHITSAGSVTWHAFAAEIFRLAKVKADLRPITSAEFNAPARRPAYSVLENAGLQKLGINRMRPWQDALAAYIHLRSQ
jgi:dTDP-4-dehydrorhamnose reductase